MKDVVTVYLRLQDKGIAKYLVLNLRKQQSAFYKHAFAGSNDSSKNFIDLQYSLAQQTVSEQ